MASKLETEVKVISSADKLWASIKDSDKLFPKILPREFKSINVLKGDGICVGSIREVTYGEAIPFIKSSKEKIEVVDNANKLVTYSVIESDILSYYKSFKPTLQVVSKGHGALVKWSVEYEKVTDDVPDPELIKEAAVRTFHELDAYLLKNKKGPIDIILNLKK